MIFEIIVPDLGATGSDVKIIGWLAEEGSFVKAGQPLFAVETDKATVEVEAFRDGYLRRILIAAGTEVELGTTVALIADSSNEPLEQEATSEPATPSAFLWTSLDYGLVR